MRYLYILLLIMSVTFVSNAQTVYWADSVIEASTELTPTSYSAEQVLGKPNVSPGTGDSPNAWMPARDDREDYLKVGFKEPIRIRQIAIAESFNPSAVQSVYIYDRSDNEFMLNTFNPRALNLDSRMLHIFFDLTEYEVAAVKVVFNGSAVPGYFGIDAIGVSNSTVPIKHEVLITENAIINVNPERLSETVNSVYNELKPLVTPDGKTLLFSRQYHPDNMGGVNDPEDIWYSKWNEEKQEWDEAVNMGRPLNNDGPNFISSITPDGNTVILTLGNQYTRRGKMKAGVSMVTRTSEGWSEPLAFEIINHINTSKDANYFLANNREVLLMSIESDPSFGQRDLYVSFLMDDGRWTEPLNLGEDVNTAALETAPFLATDDKTLYFSSNGYSGFGAQDIYVTRRLDETWTNWSTPENLGSQINSDKDDAFFNIPPTGEYGYFVRDHTDDNKDIYRFELPGEHRPDPVVTIRGKVIDAKTQQPVQARIFYERLSDGKEIGTINSDPRTGDYQIILPKGVLYGYLAEAENYLSVSANIDLTETDNFDDVTKNLFLVPIEKGAKISLNNIFFDFDKYELKKESFSELDRAAKLLKENANMKIEIAGHTDNIGTEEYNQTLSENRAKAVADYLIQNGVDKASLVIKGYGKSQPVASNDDEADGRALNRRVEFIILEN